MITFTDGSTTRYTYDATGRKLRTEHRVMTTGVFNPGLDDGGTAVPDTGGIALPFPDDPGLAVGEGGLGAWPEMSVFEELEQLLGEELAEGEEGIEEGGGEPTLPATELPVPVGTGMSSLPYELTVTDYCGNFIYENGKLSRILFDGGFITFPDSVIPHPEIAGATCIIADITRPQYHYYFTDHLGSVRIVTDAQGNIEQVNNYYPYGGLMASSSSIAMPSSSYPANQPNRYNGKELDRKNNLDWMDYGARHFAGHGQWTSPDPLAEKYYDWSPYVYCIGNPIKFVDPDGREIWIHYTNEEGVSKSFMYSVGMTCTVDNQVAKSIVSNLNEMHSNQDGAIILDAIIGSTVKYGIRQADTRSESGEGYFDSSTNIMSINDVNNTLTFAEETFHIYQYLNNQGGTTAANEVEAKLFSAKMNFEIETWYNSNNGSYVTKIAGNGDTPYPDNMSKLLLDGFDEYQYKSAVENFFSGSLGGPTYKKKGYTKGEIKQSPLIKDFLPAK